VCVRERGMVRVVCACGLCGELLRICVFVSVHVSVRAYGAHAHTEWFIFVNCAAKSLYRIAGGECRTMDRSGPGRSGLAPPPLNLVGSDTTFNLQLFNKNRSGQSLLAALEKDNTCTCTVALDLSGPGWQYAGSGARVSLCVSVCLCVCACSYVVCIMMLYEPHTRVMPFCNANRSPRACESVSCKCAFSSRECTCVRKSIDICSFE
jgi:hypothetical protein